MTPFALAVAVSILPIAFGLSGCAASLEGATRKQTRAPATVNRQIVEESFARWSMGHGSLYDVLTDDATVTIAGQSPHSGTFAKATFLRDVARPFAARFSTPLVPATWKVWSAEDTVFVRWESRATTRDGKPYANSYAYFLTMKNGHGVALTMFLDMTAFEEVWNHVAEREVATSSTSLKIWRLDCGSFTAPKNDFSDLFSHSGERGSYVDSCYLIRHGDDLMIWDAGLTLALLGKPEDASSSVRMRLTISLVAQLEQLGFKANDVTVLGISHNHLDHTGQATSFPKARLLMDKTDFAALSQLPAPFFTQPSTVQPWLAGGAPKDLIAGDRDVFGDGSVIMVALAGHTAGNHGLLVRLLHRGTVLLSGDALHSSEQLASHAFPPSNASRSDSQASLARVEGIVRDAHATLVIQHDPDSIAKLPLFPEGAD